MSGRQDEIVAGIDAAHQEFMQLVAGATPSQWQMAGVNHPEIQFGEDEHRPVGVIAHHIASAYAATIDRCRAWTRGELPPPPTAETNASHESANPAPEHEETIRLLGDNANRLKDFARGLSDEDLEAKGVFVRGETSVGEMLGETTPFHIRWHAGSIRATWAQSAG
jgi:DinB superfamily